MFEFFTQPQTNELSYGETLRLRKERKRAKDALLKQLRKDKRELEKEKPEKEDKVPLAVKTGTAKTYKCICGKEFYATLAIKNCPFCGAEGQIKATGKLLCGKENLPTKLRKNLA